ncbi:MAG: LacI family DNA-binding transcriptional regulator [Roseburia sp.]|nr:LacI family DNA-binding transcriptional regulator [Roseburia sp.]
MNIYDIAKLAGVSIATVSRVVNGSDKVTEKTRQKVLSVMEERDYTPNVFARGLGLDSMKTIGILCPNIADVFMANAISILEKNLHQCGYDCILGCSGYAKEDREQHIKLLLAKRIDALILVGSTYAGRSDDREETDYLRETAAKIPVFMINGYVDGDNIYCSYCDDFRATYEVTNGFIREGRKRILFLCDSHSFSAKRKLAGYEAALRDAGYPVCEELKFFTRNDIHFARDMLLASEALEFDSVVATEDGLAIGALKYVLAKGLSVPKDLGVAGYNNSQLSVGCEPELTSVENHLEQMCTDTIECMLRVLQGETEVARKNEVRCEVIKRGTTGF